MTKKRKKSLKKLQKIFIKDNKNHQDLEALQEIFSQQAQDLCHFYHHLLLKCLWALK
jgi:hypothetical protein